MIILFLLILIWTNALYGSHFNGGTIAWMPVYPNSNSSTILITVTQSYSYVYPTVSCTTNIPTTGSSTYLTCVSNCTTAYGFTNTTLNILTDCTSSSASLGLVFSARSVNITLNESTYFWIAYRGSAWRNLTIGGNTAAWSIVSLIDLQRRSDGLINTSPVAHVVSPQYVVVNRTTAIEILVSDVNVDDDLRCRWSLKNSSFGVDECSGICTFANLTNLASLSGCTLTITPTVSGAWYAIALQLEDFMNTTSTSPMSSVPIQFLIYVFTPNCSQIPLILNLTACLEVEVNVPITFTLYAINYCNRSTAIITDLISTVYITGMTVSSLVNSTTNTSLSYVTLSWTPQTNQIGPQQFCAVAYTNQKVQSDTYCVTFIVTTSIPCITTTTSTSNTSTQTTTTSTSNTSTQTTTTSTSNTSTQTTTSTTSVTATAANSTETTATTTTSTSTTSKTTTTITSTTSEMTTTTTSTSTISKTTTTITSTTSEMTTTASITTTTATIATTITETTTTVTTATTMTTTSATTTTETTTITDNSNQNSLPLIVGLSVFGLLLILGCFLFWVYFLKCRKIVTKSNNPRNNQVSQSSYSNTKYDDDMRKRASRSGGITTTKIKTNSNNGKSFVNHSTNGIRQNYGKNATRNRVHVVSVKKQQS